MSKPGALLCLDYPLWFPPLALHAYDSMRVAVIDIGEGFTHRIFLNDRAISVPVAHDPRTERAVVLVPLGEWATENYNVHFVLRGYDGTLPTPLYDVYVYCPSQEAPGE